MSEKNLRTKEKIIVNVNGYNLNDHPDSYKQRLIIIAIKYTQKK